MTTTPTTGTAVTTPVAPPPGLLALVPRPGRRAALTFAVVAPLLAWAYGAAGGWSGPPAHRVLMVLSALVASATLASYVPRVGLRPVVGCSSCAAMAAVTVPAAWVVLGSGPGTVSVAVLALLATSMGLAQRLRDQSSCPTR